MASPPRRNSSGRCSCFFAVNRYTEHRDAASAGVLHRSPGVGDAVAALVVIDAVRLSVSQQQQPSTRRLLTQLSVEISMKPAVAVPFVLTSMMCGGSSSTAHAEGDPAAGKTVFNKCAVCHTIDPAKKALARHCSVSLVGIQPPWMGTLILRR